MSEPRDLFIPSGRLVRMFVEAAQLRLRELHALADNEKPPQVYSESELAEAGKDIADLPQPNLDTAHVQRIISERLEDVLVSLGGRYQATLHKNRLVAAEVFAPEVQAELLDLLPFDENEGPQFCGALLEEFKAFLSAGGVIAGAFGKVVADRGMVVFEARPLVERPSVREREKIKAIEL